MSDYFPDFAQVWPHLASTYKSTTVYVPHVLTSFLSNKYDILTINHKILKKNSNIGYGVHILWYITIALFTGESPSPQNFILKKLWRMWKHHNLHSLQRFEDQHRNSQFFKIHKIDVNIYSTMSQKLKKKKTWLLSHCLISPL